MQIVKMLLFEKQEQKLVKKGSLKKEQIDEVFKIFKKDPSDYRLRPHKIVCKKDKKRRSLTVPNTPYRILYSHYTDKAVFQQILHHDDYDRINKNC